MSTQDALPAIQAAVGDSFDIHLQSMQGSTGYGWYLAGLPEGVALLGSSSTSVYSQPMVGPVRQTFTFVGLTEVNANIEFRLLAPWDPTAAADRKVYALFIGAEHADKLESEMGRGKFIAAGIPSVNMPAVIPYGFPDMGTVFPLYGYPPPPHPLYGYPTPDCMPNVNVIESAENCVLKYGVPGGIADMEHCTLKYGFPINLASKADDIIIAYGFPPTGGGGPVVAAAKGMESPKWEMKAVDENNCVVKYGTPGGISLDPDNCTVKYGFPQPKK